MKKTTVIAEIGINHDGSAATARELIAAVSSSAWGVKFQYRNVANAYADTAREIGDEILLKEIENTHIEPAQILELTRFAHERGLAVGISFFEEADMSDFGEDLVRFDFFKVPSAELTNAPLIDGMLRTGKHVFISTGCHTESQIESAFSRLTASNWTPLHCISNYPAVLPNSRLGYLTYLQKRWNRDVGYSSHDDHWEVCLLAMQMGAVVIERHVTLDKAAKGLDHSSSSTPDEFRRLADFVDAQELILAGNSPRVPNQGELLNRQNLGRSFFAARDIAAGERVVENLLVYRSPKIGFGREEIAEFLGEATVKGLKKGEPVTRTAFVKSEFISDYAIGFAREHKLSLPVRLHDLDQMQKQFPIGAYEFHLSFNEVLSRPRIQNGAGANRFSIHLPDYINSLELMDPFSPDDRQRQASLEILDCTIDFALRLQDMSGHDVPVVGSFSVVHRDRDDFFARHAALFERYRARGIVIMPQWLPPIAWYFGGSVRLHAMNDLSDAQLIRRFDLPICMDVSHLILGQNYLQFSAQALMKDLQSNIRHLHIADAAGIDGEGLEIGEGEARNLAVIGQALTFDCLKVIEVWQGHLDDGAGFRKALSRLAGLYVDA